MSGWVGTGCKYRRKSPRTGGAEELGLTYGKASSSAVLSSACLSPAFDRKRKSNENYYNVKTEKSIW